MPAPFPCFPDFIFAVIGEEAGFLGVLFVLFLFLLFAWRGYSIAYRSQDPFQAFLAFGQTTTIFLQALLNFAVVTGLVPSTGIPLPFMSYGGTALLSNFMAAAVLINVRTRRFMPLLLINRLLV